MRPPQTSQLLRTAIRTKSQSSILLLPLRAALPRPSRFVTPSTYRRHFHRYAALQGMKTHTLSDIGEGVKEVQIIQWFVEEGAAVEEWAPLCEVQSDKASVEITSKYTGVVKRLHFERDAIVQVGDAMLDIEVEGEDGEVEGESGEVEAEAEAEAEGSGQSEEAKDELVAEDDTQPREREESGKTEPPPALVKQSELGAEATKEVEGSIQQTQTQGKESAPGRHAGLATPAVRGLLKEHDLEITDVKGTGKEGRVLKEDVLKHVENGKKSAQSSSTTSSESSLTSTTSTQSASQTSKPELSAPQTETAQSLTPIQTAMFKAMTKSLQIPHFLFSDSINMNGLGTMRTRLNSTRNPDTTPKYTYLPFVVKAVSLALNNYPILNARIDTTDASKPKLQMRSGHNVGIAMDTPSGLLVPVIRNVNARSITQIAQEIQRLSSLAQAGKLNNNDLTGGTITVSNIGNIGGEAVAPVIVEGQVAILGMGKIKPTPVFAADGVSIERADLMSTSWSADHRVIDGATMARMARLVQKYIEEPEAMLVDLS